MKEKTRIYSLDVARSFAIVCVVICHVTETIFAIDHVFLNEMGYPFKLIPVLLMTVGTLGVPVFLYMTGFLLLHKPYDSAAVSRFYRTRFLLLLIVSMIWTLLWRLFRWTISGGSISLLTIWKDMFFASGAVFNQIWYLPMILSLYLLVPFLANALHASESKWVWMVLGITVFFGFVVPLWNFICDCVRIPAFYTDFQYKMQISFFMVYPVLGYLIRRENWLKKLPKPLLLLLFLGAFAGIILIHLFFLDRDFGIWIESVRYNDPVLLVCTFALFLLLMGINGEKTAGICKRIFEDISRCSFGIYLIHYVIIDAVSPFISERFSPAVAYILLTVVTFGGSWLFVRLLSFHPKTRKYLFFIH